MLLFGGTHHENQLIANSSASRPWRIVLLKVEHYATKVLEILAKDAKIMPEFPNNASHLRNYAKKMTTQWLRGAYAVATRLLRGSYAVATPWLRSGYAVATQWLRSRYAVATQ